MANNRMFLVHVPTGLAVYLGKRMGWGWYSSEKYLAKKIRLLYAKLENGECKGSQDDFAIAMEDGSESTALTNWEYGEIRKDGLVQLVMKPPGPR